MKRQDTLRGSLKIGGPATSSARADCFCWVRPSKRRASDPNFASARGLVQQRHAHIEKDPPFALPSCFIHKHEWILPDACKQMAQVQKAQGQVSPTAGSLLRLCRSLQASLVATSNVVDTSSCHYPTTSLLPRLVSLFTFQIQTGFLSQWQYRRGTNEKTLQC